MRLKAMDLNLSGLITGGNGHRLVNVILGAAVIGLLVWLFLIWSEPFAPSIDDGKTAAVRHKAAGEGKAGPRSYSVIVEKDLFSPARRKYVPPKPRPVVIAIAQGPPPPPPRKAPPRLTLIGTVLLDDGEAAIMEYAGGAQKGAYYRIGDMVEEFAVKEIRKDYVVLERDDGAVLKVTMSSSSPAPQAERLQPYRPQGRSDQRDDIPAALVPSPVPPGAAAPQTTVAPPGGHGPAGQARESSQ